LEWVAEPEKSEQIQADEDTHATAQLRSEHPNEKAPPKTLEALYVIKVRYWQDAT
jgi:hypothetical protein